MTLVRVLSDTTDAKIGQAADAVTLLATDARATVDAVYDMLIRVRKDVAALHTMMETLKASGVLPRV